MDNVNLTENQNQKIAGMNTLFSRKRLLIIGGVLVVLVLFIPFLIPSSSKKDNQNNSPKPTSASTPLPTPTISAQLQQAIDQAENSDKEYADSQIDYNAEYSWIRKLPLASEKYFVYFDLDTKTFVGRLYPESSDNAEQMKILIQKELKEDYKIPVENFKFDWQINP